MLTTFVLAAGLASVVAATPVSAPSLAARDTGTFSLVASHSGDPDVHLRSIEANDFQLWIGKPTASFCPQGVDCPPGNATSFAGGEGGLSMNVEVPGGQLAYVAPDGTFGYTQAHSASLPEGAITDGFTYTAPTQQGGVRELTGPAGFVALPDKRCWCFPDQDCAICC